MSHEECRICQGRGYVTIPGRAGEPPKRAKCTGGSQDKNRIRVEGFSKREKRRDR